MRDANSERHQRMRGARLDRDEQREQRGGRADQRDGLRRQPAGLVAADDPVDGQHQRSSDGDRARDVEPCVAGRRAQARQQRGAHRIDRDADRQVDEEDPVPRQRAVSRPPSSTPMLPPPAQTKPYTPIARARSPETGEEIHDQRQRDGRYDRAADALHRARGDQHRLRLREAARERCEREDDEAGEEHAPLAVQVAESSAEQQAAAERQQVRVDDPHEGRLGEMEVGADRRQCNVHDRAVEHDHQHAEAEDDQRVPALLAVNPVGHGLAAF